MVYRPPRISPAEVTPERVYVRRRELLKLGAAGALGLAAMPVLARAPSGVDTPVLNDVRKSSFTVEKLGFTHGLRRRSPLKGTWSNYLADKEARRRWNSSVAS